MYIEVRFPRTTQNHVLTAALETQKCWQLTQNIRAPPPPYLYVNRVRSPTHRTQDYAHVLAEALEGGLQVPVAWVKRTLGDMVQAREAHEVCVCVPWGHCGVEGTSVSTGGAW